MISLSMSWKGGQQFEISTMDGVSLSTDARARAGGSGRFPAPTDLLLAAVGGCTGLDVVSILNKMRQEYSAIRIDITGEQVEEHPRYFHTIAIRYTIAGNQLDRAKVEHAVQLSQEKYCSVRATLRPDCRVSTKIILELARP